MRRRRRQQGSEEPDLQRWLVPYADYVTLLLAFFILLYAALQTERDQYQQWLEALSASVSPLLGVVGEAESSDMAAAEVMEIAGQPGAWSDELVTQLEKRLEAVRDNQWVDWQQQGDWLELQLDDQLLFAGEQTELGENALAVLAEVAAILGTNRNYVHVRGHTDHRPVRGDDRASNWHLSAQRALTVLEVLEQEGIAPQRLALEGYGRWQPVADNRTRHGRAQNRRVVIAIANRQWQGEAPLAAEPFTPKGSAPAEEIRLFRKPGGGLLITTREDASS